jgi:hypothetical protein
LLCIIIDTSIARLTLYVISNIARLHFVVKQGNKRV